MCNYEKTIVCLANSRKMSGRCIAGKLYEEGNFGEWVRPVSTRPNQEISEEDRRYNDGSRAELLDIITIPMQKPMPHSYQVENHLIDDGFYWSTGGKLTWSQLSDAIDDAGEELWLNGQSSYNGTNDRVLLNYVGNHKYSLALIQPENLSVKASAEGAAFGDMKYKVRARFEWKGTLYRLRVTDPVIEQMALSKRDSDLQFYEPYVCISLGEPFNEFAYKLVAAIITPERTT